MAWAVRGPHFNATRTGQWNSGAHIGCHIHRAAATVNVRSTDVGALVHLTCPRLSFCISAAIVLADATTIFLAAPAMSHRHELQPSHLRLGRPRSRPRRHRNS